MDEDLIFSCCVLLFTLLLPLHDSFLLLCHHHSQLGFSLACLGFLASENQWSVSAVDLQCESMVWLFLVSLWLSSEKWYGWAAAGCSVVVNTTLEIDSLHCSYVPYDLILFTKRMDLWWKYLALALFQLTATGFISLFLCCFAFQVSEDIQDLV